MRPLLPMMMLTSSLLACATVEYGAPPVPPALGSRCTFDRSLVLVPASASLAIVDDPGFTMQPVPGGAPMFRSSGPSRSHTSSASGFSFFLGPTRLSPTAALERLNEPTLLARYESDLKQHSRGAIHRWARPLWVTLMAGSIVAMSTGLALMFNAQATRPRGGRADYGPSTAALLVGAAGLGLMLPFVALDLLNREHEAPFVAREAFLVARPDELDAVQNAVARHNEQAVAGCSAQ